MLTHGVFHTLRWLVHLHESIMEDKTAGMNHVAALPTVKCRGLRVLRRIWAT
jgi:hypothetical protein